MLGMIVAISANDVIGKNNEIPWFHKGDLKWFKETTTGHAVIMGRRTWESLPEKARPLKGRVNIVVTSSEAPFPGAIVATSVEQAINMAEVMDSKETWLIGGYGIFQEAIHLADVMLITKIPDVVELDDTTILFPAIDTSWELKSQREHPYAEGLVIEAWGKK